MEKLIKYLTGQSVKIGHFFDDDADIINPGSLDKNKNHVMVFDDCMLQDQTKIKEYFCRGRLNNVNVFYLCQSIHKISKHCIRDNANMFILLHQDGIALKRFHETHCSGDLNFKEFKEFCDDAWMKEHGFVVINKWDDAKCGRYWANYTHICVPKKYLKMLIKTLQECR